MFLSWPIEDQDKALAWQRERAKVCRCGTRREEWVADPDAYLGDLDHCEGCDRLEREQDNIPEGAKGVHTRLLPREIALARVAADEGVS